MNFFKRIILLCILFMCYISINSYASELEYVQEYLNGIGDYQEYSMNIAEYIDNLKISDDDIRSIIDDSVAVFSNIQNKMNYNEMTIIEILNIYNNFVNVSDKLNIDFNIDFNRNTVEFRDRNNGNTLLNCDIKDLQEYVDKYNSTDSVEDNKADIMNNINNKINSMAEVINDKDLSFEFKQAKVYLVVFACAAVAMLIGCVIK